MSSELHDRLEYLVNYSSQLIFVSGDSIAEQQRTLESFVFQQADNTELAFITANDDMQVTDYRRDVCRQLLGQVIGSYVRPLNELLADLNHHNGPVLITITNAQFLPNQFLQELWELVLQSRFANNKQHLNVLLFGESEWAEQAKQWLPAKNTDTPLLISSQSVTRDNYGSDVDKLLAQRRAAFDRYRQAKGQAHIATRPNRLRSPWLWLAVVLVFLSSFVALLGWQYGATLSTLFNPIEQTTQSVAEEVQANNTEDSTPTQTISVPKQTDTVIEEPVQQPSENARVVTSFTDALKTIPEPEVRTSESGEATQQSIAVPTASSVETTVAETATEQPAIAGETESESANNVGQASESQGVATELNSEQPAIAPATVDATTLMTEADPAAYYIQIAGMKDLPLAKDFLRDHNLTDKVTMYKTARYGGDWYVLLWHTSAATLLDARAMVSSLPPFPGKDAVFVKSGRQIQGELNPAR